MAQVNAPQVAPKDDALSLLIKGLGIASQVYGIRANMAQLEDHQAKVKADQDLAEGKYDKNQQLQLSERYDISPEAPSGVAYQQGSDRSTGSPLYFSSKKDSSPMIEKIAGMKNGKSGTLLVDAKTNQEIGFYPSAPDVPKNREIATVDTKGNPIVSIVPDIAGSSFPSAPKEQKAPSKEQFDAASFGKRVETANQILDNLAAQGFDRSSYSQGIRSALLPESAQSSQAKQQNQAERNFVNAVLRRESGAAISESEFASAREQYFPRAGDSPEVLAQKAQNRQQQAESLKAAAGNAWEKVAKPEIAKVKKGANPDEALAAPSVSTGPSTLDLLKLKAQSGDKQAQDYLNSLGGQ